MKSYVKPIIEYVEIRPEERFAVSSCYEGGACGKKYWEEPGLD